MRMPRTSTQIVTFIVSLLVAIVVVNWRQPMDLSNDRVIVVGGGLAGLSAAHTLVERGKNVLLLDKKPSLGGNSVKASSGINGVGTDAQKAEGIVDSVDSFVADTTVSAGSLARKDLITTLTSKSTESLAWLTANFSIDLSLVAQLGGHSVARTHRGRGPPPGFAITSALWKKLESIPTGVTIIKSANVVKLVEKDGKVVGVVYEHDGENVTALAEAVILATGGYAADYSASGYLSTFRPDLINLPTTNGDHATGDGHRLASSLNASLIDMDQIQVHPTGFVDPKEPSAKTKFLAAEALRGVGALLINKHGERFVDEMEKRDVVTKAMQDVIEMDQGPIRLLLNTAAEKELKSHCDFYVAKGLMKRYANAEELASDADVPFAQLNQTLEDHAKYARGEDKDPFGKTYFHNPFFVPGEPLLVALVVPVVHYTMGGIHVDTSSRVLSVDGAPIKGLFASGEAIGGVHGQNRLGGSSLLEALVFGRIAGTVAAESP